MRRAFCTALLLALASSCASMPHFGHSYSGHRDAGQESAAARLLKSSEASKESPSSKRDEWTWDDIDSEVVEERTKPYSSFHLKEANREQKIRFGASKHRRHYRHDMHLHLEEHVHNRTGRGASCMGLLV